MDINEIAPRLSKFEVKGLNGEFDHTIPVNTSRHVTAIIAPNGVGKTLCLKMIKSLFEKDWYFFQTIDFQSAVFEFSDDTNIQIIKKMQVKNDEVLFEDDFDCLQIEFKHAKNGHKLLIDLHETDDFRWLQRAAPHVQRVSNHLWIDRTDGERLTKRELNMRFGRSYFRRKNIPENKKDKKNIENQKILEEFLGKINCKLIETQRLIIIDENKDTFHRHLHEEAETIYAISRKSTALKAIMSTEINKYAALSQTLDRTFPQRVIETKDVVLGEGIKEQLIELDNKRQNLMTVGILDKDDNISLDLPPEDIEDSLARLLSVYIKDNEKKLESLDYIYKRVKLFQELILERFGKKDVSISKGKGIIVSNNGKVVPLEKLSSGEQHQLVLFFELLFEIDPNTLILIDEPEISLHVAWQKKFISDLLKIIELNEFDVILSTHSPQLIGKWSDLIVELGDVG